MIETCKDARGDVMEDFYLYVIYAGMFAAAVLLAHCLKKWEEYKQWKLWVCNQTCRSDKRLERIEKKLRLKPFPIRVDDYYDDLLEDEDDEESDRA